MIHDLAGRNLSAKRPDCSVLAHTSTLSARPRRSRLLGLSAAIAVLAAAGCAGSDDDATVATPASTEAPPATDPPAETDPPATDPPADPPTATEAPSGTTVEVVASEHSVITAAVNVSSGSPVLVEVTATSGDHVVEVPRTAALATEHRIPVAGMRSDREYALSIELFDSDGASVAVESASFTTGQLPAWFSDFEFEADPERSSPGYTLVEANQGNPPDESPSGQYLMAVDGDGEVVWYYQNTGAIGGVEVTSAGTYLSHYWPFGVREFDLLGNVVGNWQFQPLEAEDPDQLDAEEQAAVVDDDLLDRPLTSPDGNPGDPAPLPVRADHVSLTSFSTLR